ncbi:lysoplasmalogenase [Streptomyces sp. NPDC046557]|uniref:lysoplasmalogenase n=1 Tax=Streptomyces sp. NPDC046557 TaxID=3155372 RepID=UPI0033E2C830
MSAADSRTPSWARPVPDDTRGRTLLAAFAAAGVLDLASLLAGWHLGHVLAKPLLMPLLVAYVCSRRQGGTRLLVAALLFGWGGDLALLFDAPAGFLIGMGSFAAGHVCYLLLFGRGRTSPALGGAYALVLVAVVALLWNDLPAGLRVPVAGYSLLLTAMACRAGVLGTRAAIGGALFLLSDTLIATGVAEWPQPPRPDFWIMATYLAAQYLLVAGVMGTGAPTSRQAYGRSVIQD